MSPNKNIFQINSSDMREIAAATNPTPGNMIMIEKKDGKLTFSIDENALKMGIIAFLNNLRWMPGVAPSAAKICNTPMIPS